MFVKDNLLPGAWYVELDELQRVFAGYFRTGAKWAEVWVAYPAMEVFEKDDRFTRIYIDTLFGSLNDHISRVKLLFDEKVFAKLSSTLSDPESAICKNITRLGAKAHRVLIRQISESEKQCLPVQGGITTGFCAVGRRLKYEDAPLFFYKVVDTPHGNSGEMVVAARMASYGAFWNQTHLIENAFADSDQWTSLGSRLGIDTPQKVGEDLDPHFQGPEEISILLVAALNEEATSIVHEFNKKADGSEAMVLKPARDGGRHFWEGSLATVAHNKLYHLVLVTCLEMGAVDAAVVTALAGDEFKSDYVILLGITGGRHNKFLKCPQHERQLQLGHVVYGSHYTAYGYEKLEDVWNGLFVRRRWRPRPFSADPRLLGMANHACDIDCKGQTTVHVENADRTVGIVRGHVLTGDKVAATRRAWRWGNDGTVAIEMEAEGIWKACVWLGKGFIMIKGVSDWADRTKGGKDDKLSREVAARASARFLRDALEMGHLYR